MADTSSQSIDANTPKAAKDKKCPFCDQAFTSSSLGRHLDLYIKERNPKIADGVHDVNMIKKMRGTITRRQPRASLGGSVSRRNSSTPAGTPRAAPKKEISRDSDGYRSPAIPKDGQYAVDSAMSKFPFSARWEATGVINDIPGNGEATPDGTKRPGMQRNASKQVAQKAQFDVKQKLADAMDTARAAELALRELLSSWRAAKQHIDNHSLPFEFDPLSLDFPALTLQCLKPPPTLFSSTQHPTSTSWSVQSPGQREFEALKTFFQEEFRVWKMSCTTATTAAAEELTYPPSASALHDPLEAIRQAEKAADSLEKQVNEHLQSAYAVWETLPVPRRHELWVLELARSVGRKQKEMETMKDQQHKLKQENANLKTQIDQLNRLQQPKEFKLLPPATIPVERELLHFAYEQGVKGGKSIGFSLEDRHVDLASLVGRSIDRWKSVIVSTRANSGMSAQRSLETQSSGNANSNASPQAPPMAQMHTPQVSQQPKRQSTASTTGPISEQTSTGSTTGPPSIEENSDQDADADAEMEDDDSFAIMNASPSKPIQQAPMQHATLEIPRTRGHMQQQQQQQQHQHQHHQQQQQQQQQQRAQADPRFLMQNGSPVNTRGINMSRSMPNIPMTLPGNAMHSNEMALAMQGVRGDTMYME